MRFMTMKIFQHAKGLTAGTQQLSVSFAVEFNSRLLYNAVLLSYEKATALSQQFLLALGGKHMTEST